MSRKKLHEIISDKFDIPLEGVASVPIAQFVGNSQLSIDGCIGIKKYEPTEIILRAKDFILRINGSSLTMMTFSLGRVSIRGYISAYAVEMVGKHA